MQASTNYWFVLHDAFIFGWDRNSNNAAPTAAGGFTFNGYEESTNTGANSAALSSNELVQITTNPLPEPSTAALLGAGTLGLLGYGWRRRAAKRTTKPAVFNQPKGDDPSILSLPSHSSTASAARRAA